MAMERVVVVTGAGGMGTAVARRIGSGRAVLLADVDAELLAATAAGLRADGHNVTEHVTDVSDPRSVASLAETAGALGRVEAVAHTAGLSPVQAPVAAVLRVDLLGTALMLDAFAPVVSPGGAGVVIASMAGTMSSVDPGLEGLLAVTPTSELLGLPELSETAITDPGMAYSVAKRANQVRTRAASLVWGRRGARVNTVSPGIISTPMGAAELSGPSGDFMRSMIANSATGRLGTPDDIAAAVEFLTGPHSSFITGTDLLVDGGVVASLFTPTP